MAGRREREQADRLRTQAEELEATGREQRQLSVDAGVDELLGGPASGGMGRRSFFGASTAALLCTMGADRYVKGHGLTPLDRPTPPEPAAVKAAQGEGVSAAALNPPNGGKVREYWISAVPVRWTVVPKAIDEWHNVPVRGNTTFTGLAYRRWQKDFRAPQGPPSIPGPTLHANVNDFILVHFKNTTRQAVTLHPHGVYYDPANDGAYLGKYTKPAGFVGPGQQFNYLWQVREDSVGVWAYHDHGPNHTANVFRGLFGAIVVPDPSGPQPDVENLLIFHSFLPATTRLRRAFFCANGRAFAGNTPTFAAKVGQDVAYHLIGFDSDFHNFHLHGHRFKDPHNADGPFVDAPSFGPNETISVRFKEDNPGRWLWHCHVFTHQDMGMAGWYLVTE